MSFRATRSGRVFSPWVDPESSNVSPIYTDADFSQLLARAIEEEGAAEEDDDTELVPDVDSDAEEPTDPSPSPGSKRPYADSAKNSHRHRKRAKKRKEEVASFGHHIDDKLRAGLLQRSEAVSVDYDAAGMPAAQNAYTAKRANIANRARSYKPEELDAMGFRRVAYEAGKIRPIIDRNDFVMGFFSDKPRDDSWEDACTDAFDSMGKEYDQGSLKTKVHTRGVHVAINAGNLMGQGQKKPTRTRIGKCQAIVDRLGERESFKRIANFQSAALQLWAPRMYAYLRTSHDKVMGHQPELSRNYETSVYPMACYNMARQGDSVICYAHRDILNCPFLWCSITSLGVVDYRRGAHIVLWDLKIYFEFPPGCTIWIPSACVVHSNTPLAYPAVERRGSFTQYFPGAILRWMDNGFRTDRELQERDKHSFEDMKKWKKTRWQMGLGLFSKLGELMSGVKEV